MTQESLFHAALAISDPVKRAAFLDGACLGRPELRQAVEALLAAHDGSNPLDRPPDFKNEVTTANDLTRSYASTDPSPGCVIAGRYTLEQKLGEGGMGEVWVAKQSEPVKRKVAIKLIKAGMDTKSVVQRFEQERQALAMMDHPHIAKVLDGGITEDRRPFFVMELVNGLPLTKFCDEAKLGIKERLELFVPICQAVQHAHQKGIVHRDLKPSNILVTLVDGKAIPKVIDFGVAKATGGKLTDESLSTQFGAVIGTLEYMAPEQAGFSNIDVDTRADIYSLGIVLYELLTGLRPFDSKRLKNAALDEMIRMIREDEPSKPSTRLSTDESLPSLAAVRHIEPGKLTALLRGELDWVVMKCLEKQRDRRYETANGLARDIQRYLSNETVEARPPSAGYRLHKFVARNRVKVIAAVLILAALLLGLAGTLLGWQQAVEQRKKAQEAELAERQAKLDADAKRKEVEQQKNRAEAGEKLAGERLVQVDAEKKKAEEEKQIAIAVRDFLQNKLLGQADARKQAEAIRKIGGSPEELKENPTIRDLLDRAGKELTAEKIESNFPNQPLVQAAILQTVGDTYTGVGEPKRAIEFLERSVALRKQHLGDEHSETLLSLLNLGEAYWATGKVKEGIALHEQVHQAHVKRFGNAHQHTLSILYNLALMYRSDGRLSDGIKLLEKVRVEESRVLGLEDPKTLATLAALADMYCDDHQEQKGITLFEQVRDVRLRLFGKNHPDTLLTVSSLGKAYHRIGKFSVAITILEQVHRDLVVVMGIDHPNTLTTLGTLAGAYLYAGKVAQAIEILEKLCNDNIKKRGSDYPSTLLTMSNLAVAYQRAGKINEALALFEKVSEAQVKKMGEDHPDTLKTLSNLGNVYVDARKIPQAIKLLEKVNIIQLKKYGSDHLETLNAQCYLAGAYKDSGMLPQAIDLYEKVRAGQMLKLGADHPITMLTMNNLAATYWMSKQLDKSVPLFEYVVQQREKQLGRQHRDTQIAVANLGVNYKDSGQLAKAISLLEETNRAIPTMPELRLMDIQLLDAYLKANQQMNAMRLIAEHLGKARQTIPPDKRHLASLLARYGERLLEHKAYVEAEPLLRESFAIVEKIMPDHYVRFHTMSMLGETLLAQKKFAEAESLLLTGYDGLKKREKAIPTVLKKRLTDALDRLIQFYTVTNKPNEAAKWKKELDALKATQTEAKP